MTDQQEKHLYFLLNQFKKGQLNAAQVVAEVKGMAGDGWIDLSTQEEYNLYEGQVLAYNGKEYLVGHLYWDENRCVYNCEGENDLIIKVTQYQIPTPPKQ
jgi:hypothetical protein